MGKRKNKKNGGNKFKEKYRIMENHVNNETKAGNYKIKKRVKTRIFF